MVARPTPVATDRRFVMLSAGMGFTCGVTTDGAALCWGSNIDGILGDDAPDRCGDVGPIPCATRPAAIALPEPVTQLSSGTGHACAVSGTGVAYCWGANQTGQAGAWRPDAPAPVVPQAVVLASREPLASVSAGGIHTCAVARSGRAFCWGADQVNYGRDLLPDDVAPRESADGFRFRSISAGTVHTCGVDTRRRLLCWGDTIRGALGVR
jgi:alpha-tubulin suppressor-like RCC1 family protein